MRTALFTTHADKALPLWEPNVDQIYYYSEEMPEQFPEIGAVYFRDPFNDLNDLTTDGRLEEILVKFFRENPEARSVDNIRTVEDFYVEDKWRQFCQFGKEFMPETWLAREKEFQPKVMLIKKRISCRGRDAHFVMPERVNLDSYIIQERVEIAEEMRVFYVNGQVLRKAETRTSKTEETKVKVLGWRDLSDEEVEFVTAAMRKMPELDFVGVDLAILKDGRKVIIEVNRSPQFTGYYEVTGVNLAELVF